MAKILIVDDEKDIRNTIKTILEIEGHETDEAEKGEQAIQKTRQKKYDLILMDFFMPGISGLETIKKIKPQTKKTKIIFLTVAEFRTQGITKLKKIGVDDYIKKPFNPQTLTKKI
ncbi:MAG: response regulator, partial [Candidatus Altiarchaeales archaeon]|nr:response regulator [Candidatus Altiarchaeales archaeon]